jgi:hypothetical protein
MFSDVLWRLSPLELERAYRSKGHVEDVIATIDLEEFFGLRKGARSKSTLNSIKYFNIHGYMLQHMKRVLALQLDHPMKAVLDIGTGFGYFPYICEFFGNESIGMDVPDHVLFNDVTRFLGVKRILHRIEPFGPMPKMAKKFDLVTAFQVSFNRYDLTRAWAEEEWSFFLEDLFTNILKEEGELVFEMNYDPVHRNWLSPGARRALKKYRTSIFGRRVRVRRRYDPDKARLASVGP